MWYWLLLSDFNKKITVTSILSYKTPKKTKIKIRPSESFGPFFNKRQTRDIPSKFIRRVYIMLAVADTCSNQAATVPLARKDLHAPRGIFLCISALLLRLLT